MKEFINKRSKERAAKYGEVFTPPHIVKKMVDCIGNEGNEIKVNTTVLEPCCNYAPFLQEVLRRKLPQCKDVNDLVIAFSTVYGIELLDDNRQEALDELFEMWYNAYMEMAEEIDAEEVDMDLCNLMRYIIEHNIIQANMLENITPDGKPIIITEWIFDTYKRVKMIKTLFHEMQKDDIDLPKGQVPNSKFPQPFQEYPFMDYREVIKIAD